jgi:hypothetical protein
MPPTTSKMIDAITEYITEHQLGDKKQNSFKPVKPLKAKSVSPEQMHITKKLNSTPTENNTPLSADKLVLEKEQSTP